MPASASWSYSSRAKTFFVFLSTHSLDTAQEVCDRVGILFKGWLVALGPVDELLSDRGSADLEEVFLTITEEEMASTRSGEAR